MPPEMKRKLIMVSHDVRPENRFIDTEKWSLGASKDRAGLAADANGFTLQLMNLQNALSRATCPNARPPAVGAGLAVRGVPGSGVVEHARKPSTSPQAPHVCNSGSTILPAN